jgi:hypothetical protein
MALGDLDPFCCFLHRIKRIKKEENQKSNENRGVEMV